MEYITGINYDISKNIFNEMNNDLLIENLKQRIKFITL